MVMPELRRYIEFNLADSTAQAVGTMMQVLAATTVVSDIKVSGSPLGSGGTVNGYSTNRYRINTRYREVRSSNSDNERKVTMV